MGTDEKLVKLEKMAAQIEAERDIAKAGALFAEATMLAKEVLNEGNAAKGRVLEIVKEMDEWVARELKNE